MANFAKVENGIISGVYDLLPRNTERVSNFYLHENNEEYLRSFNWYKIKKIIPEYNSETQKLDNPHHWFEDDFVYESYNIVDLPIPTPEPSPKELTPEERLEIEQQQIADQWSHIRNERDQLIRDFEWRYFRYEREIRLGLETTDSLEKMDLYVQQLADITKQEDPFNIDWPTYES